MRLKYFNITYRCQCRCVFCAAEVPIRNQLSSMTFREIVSAALNSEPGETIVLSGGEPTLHPGLTAFVRIANARGANTILQTNGMRLADTQYAKELLLAGITEVGIPIYGFQADTHDRLTGVSGSYERTVQGIMNILQLRQLMGHPLVELKLLVCKATVNENPMIVSLLSNLPTRPDSVLLKFMVQSKTSKEHFKRLFISFHDAAAGINATISMMEESGLTYWIAGIPLCILNKENLLKILRRHSLRNTTHELYVPSIYHDPDIPDGRETVLAGTSQLCPMFSQCLVGRSCPGPEETYIRDYGVGELFPVGPILFA